MRLSYFIFLPAVVAFVPSHRMPHNVVMPGIYTKSSHPIESASPRLPTTDYPSTDPKPTLYQSSTSSPTSSSSNESSSKIPFISDSVLSASLLIGIDVFVRRLFQKLAISFPSSLGGCCALFATMLTLPIGQALFEILGPGAALLAKWLPVFFVPSLITLPLAGGIGSPTEVLKVLGVVIGGFYFTLLTTAGSVIGIRKLFADETEAGMTDNVDEIKQDHEKSTGPPPKPFSDELTNGLRVGSAISGIGAYVASTMSQTSAMAASASTPLSSLFMLLVTLHNFIFGARLPKKFTKIVHPLVTCTALTWTVATAFAAATRTTFTSVLKSYKRGSMNPMVAGAGDVLLFLLGPAVVSLAVSMYDKRKLMKENLKEVVAAVGVSSVGGLFGTAAAVRLLQITSSSLRLSLLSRNITSPLAMAIAGILGADASLAVSMVVITGLIGANFGASILDAFGIKDAVARGLGIGAAAHGLGTAAFVNEKDAFPFAAISMALTATACTVLVSIPVIKKLVMQLALGV